MAEAEIIGRFSINLEVLCQRKKISWGNLSKLSGIERTHVWKIRNMQISPRLETITKILNALNADISELFLQE